MNSSSSIVTLVLVAAFFTGSTLACLCTQPELEIYESEGYANDYVERARRFDSRLDVPDFSVYGMKNSRMYHCQDGIWLGFPQKNYAGFPYVWYQDTCVGVGSLDGAQSVQIVGDHTNSSTPTLNTFPEYHYQGGQVTHHDESRNLGAEEIHSLILVGATSVELFTGTGHTGLSICVRPQIGQITSYSELVHPNPPYPSRGTYIYNLPEVLGLPLGSIKSFTFGCRNLGGAMGTIPAPHANSAEFLAQRRRQ